MRRLILIFAIASLAWAQAPPPKPPETGWVSLFNGKDLTGWVKVGAEKWVVEDGIIHGQGLSKAYGYLRTEKKYKNFDLSLRFKCEKEGNSGVFFHADFAPDVARVIQGLQFEIDPTLNRHTGGVYGDGRQWVVWPAPELETVIRPHERLPDERAWQPIHFAAQRCADGRFYRPGTQVFRRLHRFATPFRRGGRHEVQGHHDARPEPALS